MLACVCTLSQSESPALCIQGQGPSKNLGGQVEGHSPASLSVHCGRPNAHPSSQATCLTHTRVLGSSGGVGRTSTRPRADLSRTRAPRASARLGHAFPGLQKPVKQTAPRGPRSGLSAFQTQGDWVIQTLPSLQCAYITSLFSTIYHSGKGEFQKQ